MSTYEPGPSAEGPAARAARRDEIGGWTWFGRARWLLLAAGLLAGLAAFAVGEKTHELVQAETVKKNLMGNTIREPTEATNVVAAKQNGAATFGILGLCLAAGLGIAGGLARRSIGRAVAGGFAGAILGLAVGAGLTWALLPWFIGARDDYFNYDLAISVGMHTMLWGLPGAVAGMAFVVGLGRYRLVTRAMFAGLVGAAMGAAAYDIVGAVCFASANTDDPIAGTWLTRLLACLLVTLGAAIAVAVVLPEPRPGEVEPYNEPGTPAPEPA